MPIPKLRGQSYDGAANISGKFNGVNTIIVTRQPLAFYTHCGAHRTNLIIQSLDNNVNKLPHFGMYTILIITKPSY